MQQMVQDIADASKSDNMNLYIQQIKDKYSNIISNNEYLKDLLLE